MLISTYCFLILCFVFMIVSLSKDDVLSRNIIFFSFLIYCLGIFGFRDESIGSDTRAYLSYYSDISPLSFIEALFYNRFELGFSLLSTLISRLDSISLYLPLIAVIQAGLMCFFLNKNHALKSQILVLITYLSFFLYVNLSTNILRQGLAFPLCIGALLYLADNNKTKSLICIIVAALFHQTSLLLILPLAARIIKISPSKIFYAWLCVLLLSPLLASVNLVELILSILRIDKVFAHLINDTAHENYNVGFKLTFFLFSALPGCLYLLSKYKIRRVSFIENIYTSYFSLNIIFLVSFSIPYSDRLAVYSWGLIPLLIIYTLPFKYLKVKSRTYVHLQSNQKAKINYYLYLAIVFLLGGFLNQYYPLMMVTGNLL